jgi:hypothetical protein
MFVFAHVLKSLFLIERFSCYIYWAFCRFAVPQGSVATIDEGFDLGENANSASSAHLDDFDESKDVDAAVDSCSDDDAAPSVGGSGDAEAKHENALRENIARKGKNAYYYAHAHKVTRHGQNRSLGLRYFVAV